MDLEKIVSEAKQKGLHVIITIPYHFYDDGYSVDAKWSVSIEIGEKQILEEVMNYSFGTNSNYQGIFQEQHAREKCLTKACQYAKKFLESGIDVTIDNISLKEAREKLAGLDKEYHERLKYF